MTFYVALCLEANLKNKPEQLSVAMNLFVSLSVCIRIKPYRGENRTVIGVNFHQRLLGVAPDPPGTKKEHITRSRIVSTRHKKTPINSCLVWNVAILSGSVGEGGAGNGKNMDREPAPTLECLCGVLR